MSRSQIAQIMPCGTGHDGVPKCREKWAGVECAQRLFRIEAECAGTVHRGGIGDGAGVLGVAVDAIGAGAQNAQHFTGMTSQFQRAGEGELLVAAAGARSAVHGDRNLSHRN